MADVLFKGTRQTKQRPVIIVGNELALDVDVISNTIYSFLVPQKDQIVRKSRT